MTKCELAKKYGFTMISSSRSGDDEVRNPADVLRVIIDTANSGEAEGKIFVFDTMKKFVSMMDKSVLPQFFCALRRITACHGTVILLGHANKNLSLEGKLVYEGVSDIKGDIDIQYAIYNMSDRTDERQVLKFVNEKDRGRIDMERVVEYRKSIHMSYEAMLESVVTADQSDVKRLEAEQRKRAIYDRYEFEVPFILHVLKNGEALKTKVVDIWKETKGKCELAGRVAGRDRWLRR